LIMCVCERDHVAAAYYLHHPIRNYRSPNMENKMSNNHNIIHIHICGIQHKFGTPVLMGPTQ
jgi:hypothetical protein